MNSNIEKDKYSIWPHQMNKFIVKSIIKALSDATFPSKLADAVHRSEYVKRINDVFRDDPDMAPDFMRGFECWDRQNKYSRLLMTSLFKVAKQFGSNREKLFSFCMEKYPDEKHSDVQIGLVFGTFHCSIDEDEDKLCNVIDWVSIHLKQFDKVCSGFYGPPDVCLKDMRERLLPDPNFYRAAPLYFFNLRAEVGMTDEVRSLIMPFLESDRPSCRKAAKVVLNYDS